MSPVHSPACPEPDSPAAPGRLRAPATPRTGRPRCHQRPATRDPTGAPDHQPRRRESSATRPRALLFPDVRDVGRHGPGARGPVRHAGRHALGLHGAILRGQGAELAEFETAMRYMDQPVHAYLAQLAVIQEHNTVGRLGEITTPALVMAGEEDILHCRGGSTRASQARSGLRPRAVMAASGSTRPSSTGPTWTSSYGPERASDGHHPENHRIPAVAAARCIAVLAFGGFRSRRPLAEETQNPGVRCRSRSSVPSSSAASSM